MSRKPLPRGLYAITDSQLIPPGELTRRVSMAIAGGAVLIQYRDKGSATAADIDEVVSMAMLCRQRDVPLIVNDDVELAAAIGADLPIDEPVGNMVIDIGGGTSETAVISLGGIVALEAVRVGSFDIDAAIQNYVRREHGIAIGERTAEEIKVAIGSADPTPDENQAEVRGRDLMTGLPKTVILTPEEVRYAIEDVVSSIVASVIRCLSKAPPELSQDFLVRGMYLVGGGGLLRGLAERIERETEVPVKMSNVPLEAVVLGAGHVIEHYEALKGMFMGARR